MAKAEVFPTDGAFIAKHEGLSLGFFATEATCQRVCDILTIQNAVEHSTELDRATLHNSPDTYTLNGVPLADILPDVPADAVTAALQARASKPAPGAPALPSTDLQYPGPGSSMQQENVDDDEGDVEEQLRREERHSSKPRWWRVVEGEDEDMAVLATTLTHEDCHYKRLKPPRDWYAIFFGFRCKEITAKPDTDTAQALALTDDELQDVPLSAQPSTEDEAGEYVWESAAIFDTLRLEPGDFLIMTKVGEDEVVLGAPPAVALSIVRREDNDVAAVELAESIIVPLLGPASHDSAANGDSRDAGSAGDGDGTGLRRRTSRSRKNPYGDDFVGGEIYDEAYYSAVYHYDHDGAGSDGELGPGGGGRRRKRRGRDIYGGVGDLGRSGKRVKQSRRDSGGLSGPAPRVSLGIARVRVSGQRVPAAVLERLHMLDANQFLTMLTNFYVGLRGGFRVPNFGRQTLNLHTIFWAAMERGGYESVTMQKHWKAVCRSTGIDLTGLTSASNCMRTNYERCLLDFENYLCSGQYELDLLAGVAPAHTHLTDPSATRFYVPPPPATTTDVGGVAVGVSVPAALAAAPHWNQNQQQQHIFAATVNGGMLASLPSSASGKLVAVEGCKATLDGGIPTPSALTGSPAVVGEDGSGTSSDQINALGATAATTGNNGVALPTNDSSQQTTAGDSATAAGGEADMQQQVDATIISQRQMKAVRICKAQEALELAQAALDQTKMPWITVMKLRRAVESNGVWVAELHAGLKEAIAFGESLAQRQREAELQAETAQPPDPALQQRIDQLKMELEAIKNEQVRDPVPRPVPPSRQQQIQQQSHQQEQVVAAAAAGVAAP